MKDWIVLQLDRFTDGQFLLGKITVAMSFLTYIAVMGIRNIKGQIIGFICILVLLWLTGYIWNKTGLKKRYTEVANRYLKVGIKK